MKIVIELSEEDYNDITLTGENTINLGVLLALRKAVRNGTPLPEHHGRLMILSEDKVKENQIELDFSCQKWISEVGLSYATIAIIEADRGE